MNRDKKIIYMGTPQFAVAPLKRLMESGYNICAVVTAPDKPSGRGLQLSQSDVKQFAIANGLEVLQPVSLKDPEFLNRLKSFGAELFVVVAFRMLPADVWKMPGLGTFNLHASLLPQYRGAAPINHAIINGERKTGVTTFLLDEKIDTGAVLFQKECLIEPHDNMGSLHDKLMEIGSELVVLTAEAIFSGNAKAIPQPSVNEQELKPAPKLSRETGSVDWKQSAESINNLIRGLSPYPAAYSVMKTEGKEIQVKIFSANLIEQKCEHSPGTIVKTSKTSFMVACGDGYLSITSLQPSGKRKMTTAEFMAGMRDPENWRFE